MPGTRKRAISGKGLSFHQSSLEHLMPYQEPPSTPVLRCSWSLGLSENIWTRLSESRFSQYPQSALRIYSSHLGLSVMASRPPGWYSGVGTSIHRGPLI